MTYVAPTKQLQTQVKNEVFKLIANHEGIEVLTPKLMSKGVPKSDVYIVDEGDYQIEEKHFIFSNQDKDITMSGACRAFLGEHIIFMSARFNDQQKRFLSDAYGIKNEKITAFKPRYELDGSADVNEALEHEAEVNESEEYLV